MLTVPVGDVLVGDTGSDVEHDDAALSVDVVTISETAKLLLSGSVPHVELDLAEVLRDSLVPRCLPASFPLIWLRSEIDVRW